MPAEVIAQAAPITPTAVKPTVAAVTPTPVAPAESPEMVQARKMIADADAKLAAAEKVRRVHAAETRKFADEKKGIGAKLSEYDAMKKREGQAKLNKAAYLEQLYGKDWYDQIIQERLNGGAPTADTVALEVEKVREEFAKKFEEHKSEQTKAQQAQHQQQIQAELRAFNNQATEFAKANAKDYPIFERLGGEGQVGLALVQRIRAEHDRTIQRDESGAVTSPGKVLTLKEAADAIEADLIAIAETAFGHEKYKPKLTEKMKPAPIVSAVTGGPQLRRTEVERRTLSNDLTATTPGRQPARTDDERRERAIAAYATARAKAPSQ